jgi:hypothetical protein
MYTTVSIMFTPIAYPIVLWLCCGPMTSVLLRKQQFHFMDAFQHCKINITFCVTSYIYCLNMSKIDPVICKKFEKNVWHEWSPTFTPLYTFIISNNILPYKQFHYGEDNRNHKLVTIFLHSSIRPSGLLRYPTIFSSVFLAVVVQWGRIETFVL